MPKSWILYPERAVLLFGRASFAATDVYKRSPTWEALIANPDPASVASAGYSYVYMDAELVAEIITSDSSCLQPTLCSAGCGEETCRQPGSKTI